MFKQINSFSLFSILDVLLLSLVFNPAYAALDIWTGEDLYNDEKVMFPTDVPMLDGNSIVFPGGTIDDMDFGKLIELELEEIPKNGDVLIRITMNLTRLYGDWDPSIGLTDGSDYIGINISDYFDSPSAGAATFVKGTDEGDRVDWTDGSELFKSTGFPLIGETVDVMVEFDLTPDNTQVSVSTLGRTGSYSTDRLNRSNGLSFAFIRDGRFESYGVNTLSIETINGLDPHDPDDCAVELCPPRSNLIILIPILIKSGVIEANQQ